VARADRAVGRRGTGPPDRGRREGVGPGLPMPARAHRLCRRIPRPGGARRGSPPMAALGPVGGARRHLGLRIRAAVAADAVHRLVVRPAPDGPLRAPARHSPPSLTARGVLPRRCVVRLGDAGSLPGASLPTRLHGNRERPFGVPLAPARPGPALCPLHRLHPPGPSPLEARGDMSPPSVVPALAALGLAPLLPGVMNRTKAAMAGRLGQPLLQPYHDVMKLLRKGAVYSRTSTWVFRAGPVVGLAAVILASALVPFGSAPALVRFPGDLLLFVYLLAVSRFFTVIA